MTRPSLQTIALLPVRIFFGATFLWAGLDKLLDPAFLDPTASTSLHAQLVAFARFSPLGGLIQATLPFSSIIGLLIAVAELGVGIGALSGLAFRVASVGGMLLSLLFWLTASWATHPYYFGADLPYAFGWLALAIAGHSGYLVPARFSGADPPVAAVAMRGTTPEALTRAQRRARRRAVQREPNSVPSPERRLFLQTVTLAGLAAIVASFTLPLRAAGLLSERPVPSSAPPPLPTPEATVSAGAVPVAKVADVKGAGSAAFTVPFNAPSPLPAGDPAVIVELANGTFVAFDAVCTHAGCTVEWDQADRVLLCPCHGAAFDPEHAAAVLQGPAPTPLTSLPLVIDAATGTILLVPQAG
ncbi:MAG TPA: Rieske 2Fe-2S domain-containing protein [Candidatus Dormibacteraeota bacterium]|nr:Rieske 2Fe-2S domain-containing protein [Candidatus Dormibacteraeota bacterium]